ncbi:ChaN family lipoprotein [Ectopseudomonas hydrolytica]|uniref:ChaN family lipoprotein n=1 Tax=Ectopseudomonas hydrolytica TaxID=2493633 RepID=UPI003EE17C08
MRALLLSCLVLLGACQSQNMLPPPAPLAPLGHEHVDFARIVDLASGQTISPEQLLARLAPAQRVLVGEQHDNPDHHALQLWLLRELSKQRPQGSVLMEMLNPDQQNKIDQAQAAARAGQTISDPLATLAWQPGWSWSLYGPLVLHQLRQPIRCSRPIWIVPRSCRSIANARRCRVQRSSAVEVQERLQEDIRASHCGLLPDSQLPAMLAVQQQRDRRMAEALLAAPQPSLLLAGAFHVRKDLGVPLHLADLGAQAGSAVLILAEVGREVDASMADYVWFTAAQPQQDHCAKLRP